MDAKEFVAALRIAVRKSSIEGTIGATAHPPGRKVDALVGAKADWFNALNEREKEHVSSLIVDAVDNAIFSFLCVLDGVRAIEDTREKGILELWFIGSERQLLNPPRGIPLHDIYNEQSGAQNP